MQPPPPLPCPICKAAPRDAKRGYCVPCDQQRARTYYHANVAAERERSYLVSLKSRFNMSADDYESLLIDANSRCEICDKLPQLDADRRTLEVDHVPGTDLVRGVLCHPCNIMVAQLDPDLIERALAYLMKPPRHYG